MYFSLASAYFALGVSKEDEVIVPALTFYATATPLFQLGAVPVLVDCENLLLILIQMIF